MAQLTPEDFTSLINQIARGATADWHKKGEGDPEQAHHDADDLIVEVMESLGYHEGIKVYRDMVKWFS